MNNNVGKFLCILASALLLGIVYYITLPTLSLFHLDGILFFAFTFLVIVVNTIIWGSEKLIKLLQFVGMAFGILLVVGLFIGSPLFTHETKYAQLGDVEVLKFEEMIKEIDHSQIPIVDDDFAQKQADKKIGEDIALGSRTHLGNAHIQEVNGEILYVAPLEHSGILKWNKHRSTPGYITVSATNANKVNYITEIDGKPINLIYSPSAFFSKDLKRHIRNEGFKNIGLTEYTFEINDEGKPFWVVTTYKNTTLWGTPEATGVIIVDAQTGQTNYYSTEEVPDWVDIVQPKYFIENQINNWGKYVHGVFNFSNEDKIEKTNRTLTVYVDGDCYYFTGMTSVGSDESCVGFIMVNTRNKKSMICYMSGATEDAAMRSAEGIVSDFGYASTEPLPLIINGIPTYVMSLKDEEGLVKSYAMVNIELYSIVAKGNTLQETSRSYMQKVAQSGHNTVVSSDEAYGYTLEGIVSRISSVVEDGSTYYYIIIENEENKIFTASYITSDELAITRDGDTVIIEYIDDLNGTVDIINFDNTAYGINISEAQENRNELDKNSSVLDDNSSQIIKVTP